MAAKKYDIDSLREESKSWRIVAEDNLNSEMKAIYQNRKRAVELYLNGEKVEKISWLTGLDKSQPAKLLKLCCAVDSNGVPHGFPALIPYKRFTSYERKQSTDFGQEGLAGAFRKLLKQYPELETFIRKLYFQEMKSIYEKNIAIIEIYKKFIKKCRSIGIKENEYPFNSVDLAERSLYRYINDLKNKNPEKSIKRYGDEATGKLENTGTGIRKSMYPIRPLSQTQFDGHKVDCLMNITSKTQEGDVIKLLISRIWLLILIDVPTRVILGHHLTIQKEYNRFDVLTCIRKSIEPKRQINFNIEGFKYPENGGFHSMAIPKAEWAVFDEIMFDNALAHLSNIVNDRLVNYLDCTVNFGPVAVPERRGIVERLFETLESRGYHRLVSTTGSGPKDPRRKNAEADAIKFDITFEDLEEITELVIAQYNNSPHDGLGGFTPLEIMEQRISRGLTPSYLRTDLRQEFKVDYATFKHTICGSLKSGRRPYITLKSAEYRSETLSRAYDLVGQKITTLVNPNDMRVVKAFYEDGSEFGDLYVSGKWSRFAHSIKDRENINKFIRENKIKLTEFDDVFEIYHNYKRRQALESRSARNELAAFEKSISSKDNSKIENDFAFASNTQENETKELLTDEQIENIFYGFKNRIKPL